MMPGGPMSRDPAFYDNPETFDRLRFYNADDDTSKAAAHIYTAVEPGNLSWGNGRFTCPGRWYGAAMIKLILAIVLLHYDVSFPKGQSKRPANIKYDTEVLPDFSSKVCFWRRHKSQIDSQKE
jgi:cytochrome P450